MFQIDESKVKLKVKEAEKEKRNEDLDNLTVNVEGLVFDADETSQLRMLRTYLSLSSGQSVSWILHDNRKEEVTRVQLKKALDLAISTQNKLWTESI